MLLHTNEYARHLLHALLLIYVTFFVGTQVFAFEKRPRKESKCELIRSRFGCALRASIKAQFSSF